MRLLLPGLASHLHTHVDAFPKGRRHAVVVGVGVLGARVGRHGGREFLQTNRALLEGRDRHLDRAEVRVNLREGLGRGEARHLLHLSLRVDVSHPVDRLVCEEPRDRFRSFGGGMINVEADESAAPTLRRLMAERVAKKETTKDKNKAKQNFMKSVLGQCGGGDVGGATKGKGDRRKLAYDELARTLTLEELKEGLRGVALSWIDDSVGGPGDAPLSADALESVRAICVALRS